VCVLRLQLNQLLACELLCNCAATVMLEIGSGPLLGTLLEGVTGIMRRAAPVVYLSRQY
jgi:hypothetical protein